MSDDPLVVSLKRPRMVQSEPQSARAKRGVPWRLYVGAALTMTIIISSGYYFLKGQIYGGNGSVASVIESVDNALNGSDKSAVQAEIDDLIATVGMLIVLPEGEIPTVATVTDPEKLKDQPFFSRAKSGDKVLLYTQARKAYLYDPTQNKLLEVAPITTEPQ